MTYKDGSMNIDDGGPAFPCVKLEKKRYGPVRVYYPGQSLRDYFAGQAMLGLMTQDANASLESRWCKDSIAELAYIQADAMLKERS